MNNVKYKYTEDKVRESWIDAVYPYGFQIMSILPKIEWASYSYEGTLLIKKFEDVSISNNENRKFDLITTKGTVKSPDTPYQVFGGAACELWARELEKEPCGGWYCKSNKDKLRIRDIVDPTGDIDVRIASPEYTITDESYPFDDNDELNLYIDSDANYTEFGDNYTRWLFNQVVDNFSKIKDNFNKSIFSLPDKNEDYETDVADLYTRLGNLLISRSVIENMIKIQVSIKVATEVNTLLELVILKDDKTSFKHYNKPYVLNNIYLMQPKELLYGQIKGLFDRGTGIYKTVKNKPDWYSNVNNYSGFYKYDNHCARIVYLVKLLKIFDTRQHPDTKFHFAQLLGQGDILSIIKKIYRSDLLSKLCEKHYDKDYMTNLIELFKTFKNGKALNDQRFITMIQNSKNENVSKWVGGTRKKAKKAKKSRKSMKSRK